MQKFNSQKGAVEISTAAAMAIIAAIVAAVSICSTVLYFDIINAPVPITAINPESKPTAAPTPSADETADWQTFKSDKYKFQIKYPLGWTHGSDVMAESFNKIFIKNSVEFNCSFSIYAVQTDNFDNYLNNYYLLNPKRTSIIIGAIPAIKIESSQEKGFYGDYGIKRSDQENFSFHITATIEKITDKVAYGTVNDQNCINIFGQILSTFSFTGTGETADWKVISSATEGYELKYPADLNLGRNLPPRVIIDDKDMPELSEGIIKNVTETTVNGINFIVIVSEGAAAGSTYPDYFYKTEHDGKSFTIYFPVRYPTDCKTYAASADQTKCETFKTGLDGQIEKIVATFKFTK